MRVGLPVASFTFPGGDAAIGPTVDRIVRTYLGLGAAWNEVESRSLGFPMPPIRQRFEWLEDTLRFAHEMWSGERGSDRPFTGTHLRADRALNSPQALTRPHPPILIGGGGERRTLRLVAQYADACNVFGSPEQIAHKYEVLREQCETIGRDDESIERTAGVAAVADDSWGARDRPAMSSAEIVDARGAAADAGCQHAMLALPRIDDLDTIERIGRDVLPQVRDLGEVTPLASAG